jgi:hypothetical protein
MNTKPRGLVHYVIYPGECRPFLITRAWNDTIVNGTLFIDGANDYSYISDFRAPTQPYSEAPVLTVWRSSVRFSGMNETNTWHYPESEAN